VGSFTGETFPDTMTNAEFVAKYGAPDVFMTHIKNEDDGDHDEEEKEKEKKD